jgi:hypothetical protein
MSESSSVLDFALIGSPEEPRIFTLAEANVLFPLVQRITERAHGELLPSQQRLRTMLASDPRRPDVEVRYEAVVRRWMRKMERLGVVVKGLWLVDFDTGDGYLCWKYPELGIGHYHDYASGFDQRRPLREIMEELDPDWAW